MLTDNQIFFLVNYINAINFKKLVKVYTQKIDFEYLSNNLKSTVIVKKKLKKHFEAMKLIELTPIGFLINNK